MRLFILLLLGAAPARADWLVLLQTTDRHGHIEGKEDHGGAALLGGYLANARKAGPVVLLDSGDLFQGTMVSNLGEGQAVVRAMNLLGYAASALGNHEFDYGPVGPHSIPKGPEDPLGALRARASEAKFPLLSANITGEKVPWKKWQMITAARLKIGVVGGTSEDLFRTTIKPNLVGIKVEPLGLSVSLAAAEARKAGAQLVVVVVHAGGNCPYRRVELSNDKPGDVAGCEEDSEVFRLARELQSRWKSGQGGKVDALFAGHTHKSLTAVIDGLPVAQPLPLGLGLAEIDLEIEKGVPTGRFRVEPNVLIRAGQRYRDLPVAADQKVDASFAEDLARSAQRRAALVGVVLEGGLPRASARESPLGNLVADLVRRAAHAEIGFMNGGGLRADLPAGPLTYGSLFEALPFDNRLATIDMEGAAIRRMIERNLKSEHGILSISGARVSARCGEKGLAVSLTLDDGEPMDESRRYRVGTSDFLALGGDDFGKVSPPPVPHVDEEAVLRDLAAVELARLAVGGVLRGDDVRFWDPAHKRMDLPSERPVRCAR